MNNLGLHISIHIKQFINRNLSPFQGGKWRNSLFPEAEQFGCCTDNHIPVPVNFGMSFFWFWCFLIIAQQIVLPSLFKYHFS